MTYDDAKKAFVKTVNDMSGKYPAVVIFSDFVEMAAISLHNALRKRDDLEKRYLNTAKKYSAEELNRLSSLLAFVVEGLEDRFGDFLGECYGLLQITNKSLDQFFTPYHIAKMSAKSIITDDAIKQGLDKHGVISILEPACGGGAMIIGALDVLKEKGVNFQKHAFVTAMDLDSRCVYMTYITLTLLGVPAVVVLGNTLTMEVFDTLYTPFYRAMPADMKKEDTELLDSVLETVKPIEQGVQLSLF